MGVRAIALFVPLTAALLALPATLPAAEPKIEHRLYESSIGGVIPASKLPGAAGQGYLVYQKWCAGCHAAAYQPVDKSRPMSEPPAFAVPLGTNVLQQRTKGSGSASLELRTNLTPQLVQLFVRRGVNAMPPFRKTEISDSELAALATYLTRNNPAPAGTVAGAGPG